MTFPLAKSVAGRDKNSYYAAVRFEEDRVFIADGRRRKLVAPKSKSLKHVIITEESVTLSYLTDRDLRRKLWEHNFGGRG